MRVVVLASGRGSNLKALYKASQVKSNGFTIEAVISDNEDSDALVWADDVELANHVIEGADREDQLDKLLRDYEPDLICLAGYMRILSAEFVNAWEGKIINIHPSLLPKYKGLDTHKRALVSGDKTHGATVHWVTEKVDDGPILAQSKVPILSRDNESKLANRVLKEEHKLYVKAVKMFIKDIEEKTLKKPPLLHHIESSSLFMNMLSLPVNSKDKSQSLLELPVSEEVTKDCNDTPEISNDMDYGTGYAMQELLPFIPLSDVINDTVNQKSG